MEKKVLSDQLKEAQKKCRAPEIGRDVDLGAGIRSFDGKNRDIK